MPTESHMRNVKRAREEFGFIAGRNPNEARLRMEEEQAANPPLTGDDFRAEFAFAMEALDAATFRTASTMPENPHAYTLLRDWDPLREEDFFRIVRFIRSNGAIRKFQGWPYVILEGPEFFYWTTYWPVPMVDLINRKPVSELDQMR